MWFTVVRMVLMFIDGIAMRNKLIMRKVFQEIEVVEVDGILFRLVGGFWFRSVELNSLNLQSKAWKRKWPPNVVSWQIEKVKIHRNYLV